MSWDRIGPAAMQVVALLAPFQSADDADPWAIFVEGLSVWQQSQWSKAREPFTRALELAVQRGDARTEAFAGTFLGHVLLLDGRYDDAVSRLTSARPGVEQHGDTMLKGLLFVSLGDVLSKLGRLDEAAACLRDGATLAEEAGDVGLHSLFLSHLAVIEHKRGDIEAARAGHDRAVALADASGQALYRSQVLAAAARFEMRTGNLTRAREHLERGRELAGPPATQIALAGQLASLDLLQGDYPLARDRIAQAAALADSQGEPRFLIEVRQLQAGLAFRLGRYAEAREHLAVILALLEESPDEHRRLQALADMAVLYQAEGRIDEARAASADLLETVSHEPSPDRWRALAVHAWILRDARELPASIALHEEALALARELLDPDAELHTLRNLGFVLAEASDWDAAEAHTELALQMAEEQALDDEIVGLWHTLAVVRLGRGDIEGAEELLARAEVLLDRPTVLALGAIDAAGVRSKNSEWGEIDQDLVAARLARSSEGVDLVEGLRQASRWKGRSLLDGRPERAAAATDPRSIVPARGLLVDFVPGTHRLYAYVLDAQHVRCVDLGERRPIETRIGDFVAGLDGTRALLPAADVVTGGRALFDILIAPCLAAAPGEHERLVVVPAASMASLPFEALVVEAPAGSPGFADVVFAGDRYAISYGPSSAVLAALDRPADRPRSALFVGDPVYFAERQAVASRSADPHLGYGRLPASRDEVFRLAQMFLAPVAPAEDLGRLALMREQRSAHFSSGGLDLLVGEEATLSRLLEELAGHDLVHLAVHGIVDRNDPRGSGVLLSHPAVGSGFLSVTDAAALQLDADLVVLSACETARGRLLKGEGVQSLAWAFLHAGSRAVVASLWRVADDRTEAVMTGFYRRLLLEDASPDVALREAKRALRAQVDRGSVLSGRAPPPPEADRAHPFAWAPFIYVGSAPD